MVITLAVSAFVAGLTTSVGPCVAPRYLALAALVANSTGRARWLLVVCFVAGLLLCYSVLAMTVSLIAGLAALSRLMYLGLALCFLGFGLRAIAAPPTCAHRASAGTSPGAALIAGGALGMVFSPCCTPVVGLMASIAMTPGSLNTALLCVVAFVIGHIAPLATVGVGLKFADRFAFGDVLSGSTGTIAGGLSVALACYYALLA